MATAQFLEISVPYVGYVLRDEAVRRAAGTSRPFLIYQPGCAASRCVRWIASRLAKADLLASFLLRQSWGAG